MGAHVLIFESSQPEGLCVGDLFSKLVYNQMYTHICVNTSDTGKLRKIGGLYQCDSPACDTVL